MAQVYCKCELYLDLFRPREWKTIRITAVVPDSSVVIRFAVAIIGIFRDGLFPFTVLIVTGTRLIFYWRFGSKVTNGGCRANKRREVKIIIRLFQKWMIRLLVLCKGLRRMKVLFLFFSFSFIYLFIFIYLHLFLISYRSSLPYHLCSQTFLTWNPTDCFE